MKTIEKVLLVVALIAFLIILGSGALDVYVAYYTTGVDRLLNLGTLSAKAIAAIVVIFVATGIRWNSSGERKKRSRRKRRLP